MSNEHADLLRRQIEAEMADLNQHLAASVPPDDFLGQLLHSQAHGRLDALGAEMDSLESEVFELAFSDQETIAKHSLSTSVLTNLLGRFQRALTFAGWARVAGPGVRGTPPAAIARAMETEVNAFVPGSFAIELTPYQLALEHEALDAAFDDFLTLANAGLSEDAPTPTVAVTEVAQLLGAEATRRFALFFAKVHEAHLEARFGRLSDPDTEVQILPEQALQLSAWLKGVEQAIATVTVSGVLSAADSLTGRFALTDELGEVHEGRAAPELLSRGVIDGLYVATMRVTTSKSNVTRAENKHAVLEALTAREDSDA